MLRPDDACDHQIAHEREQLVQRVAASQLRGAGENLLTGVGGLGRPGTVAHYISARLWATSPAKPPDGPQPKPGYGGAQLLRRATIAPVVISPKCYAVGEQHSS